MRRADNLTTFTCRLSRNSGAPSSWNPKGLSRPVAGKLYLLPLPYFLHFCPIWTKLGTGGLQNLACRCEFRGNLCGERDTSQAVINKYPSVNPHVHCPSWLTFGTRNLHMALRIFFCEFREYRRREGSKQKYISACAVKPQGLLEVNNALLLLNSLLR